MDGKPPAALIRQLNTIADVYTALRLAGFPADRARRIVCDLAGARPIAAAAVPAKLDPPELRWPYDEAE